MGTPRRLTDYRSKPRIGDGGEVDAVSGVDLGGALPGELVTGVAQQPRDAGVAQPDPPAAVSGVGGTPLRRGVQGVIRMRLGLASGRSTTVVIGGESGTPAGRGIGTVGLPLSYGRPPGTRGQRGRTRHERLADFTHDT